MKAVVALSLALGACATVPPSPDPAAAHARIAAEFPMHHVARAAATIDGSRRLFLFDAPFDTCKPGHGNRFSFVRNDGYMWLGCWTEANGSVHLAFEDGDSADLPSERLHVFGEAPEQQERYRGTPQPGDIES